MKMLILLVFIMPLSNLAVAASNTPAGNPCIIKGHPYLGEKQKNWGHRMGGDYFGPEVARENSLTALKYSLVGYQGQAPIQNNACFMHFEFDVNSTADDVIVLHHNRTMCPKASCKNSKEFKAIKNLTLAQIRSLAHGSADLIPTLEEALTQAAQFQLKKTISVDIKELHSDKAKINLITQLLKYRSKYSKSVPGLNSVDKQGNFNDFRLITGDNGFGWSFARRELDLDATPSEYSAQYWCDSLKQNRIVGVKSYGPKDYDPDAIERGANFCDNLDKFAAAIPADLSSGSKNVLVKADCPLGGFDGGCKKTLQCPEKTHIVAVRAACNLEKVGAVTLPEKWNSLSVSTPSNSPKGSSCKVNDVDLQTGTVSLQPVIGEKLIKLSCSEKDGNVDGLPNGGDCRIAAHAICVPDFN